jgi:zinc D-Ala-D-Ala carboxypeptidase
MAYLPDTQLSPHFYLSEFCVSQTAARADILNQPYGASIDNLKRLALKAEEVRKFLNDAPILISSGFRSISLNRLIGSKDNSAHTRGCAMDFTAPAFGAPRQICQQIIDSGITFDQLICEGTWVHLGIAEPSVAPRREVLTARFNKAQPTTYFKGLA